MNTIPFKLDEMEQDLILACKCWYGKTGIDKVISTYFIEKEESEVK